MKYLLILAAVMFLFPGCASTDGVTQMVCHEQLLGTSDQGLLVVRHFCMKEPE